jgi:hypothetical protein
LKQDEQIDGRAIDDRFKDQGRVPLFYVSEPPSSSSNDNNNNASALSSASLRLFFNRKDLLRSWTDRHPGERLPPVQVLDLISIFENTMRGRANIYLPDKGAKNLEFVPSAAALAAGQELKTRGQIAPYSATKMII